VPEYIRTLDSTVFRLLLSPYSLVGTCIFRDFTGTFIPYCRCREAVKLYLILEFNLSKHHAMKTERYSSSIFDQS
jgi:hypothetical protein